MPRTCQSEGCTNNVFGGNMCKFHQYKRTDKKQTSFKSVGNSFNANAKPVAKASAKRKEVDSKLYFPASKAFRKQHPNCQIRIKGICTNISTGVHHVKGRTTIELLLDQTFWLSACNACNLWVELNPKEAEEKGFKIPDYKSKLSKFKNK